MWLSPGPQLAFASLSKERGETRQQFTAGDSLRGNCALLTSCGCGSSASPRPNGESAARSPARRASRGLCASRFTEYYEILERTFANFDRKPDIAVECDGATSLLAVVESGHGVALVPEVFRGLAGSRVKLRPIAPAPPPMIVGCAHTTSSASTVAAQRFLTIARSVYGESGESLGLRSRNVP
jgi:DNA-binding transcriptional LysR family regulator